MSVTTTVPRSKKRSQTVRPGNESVIAVYKNHLEAVEAARKLKRAGISIQRISIFGRGAPPPAKRAPGVMGER